MSQDWRHIDAFLRLRAEQMTANPDSYTQEEGRALDRALRTCPTVIDIDVVWVRWRYVGEPRGWITTDELVTTKKGYCYPK